MSIDSTADSCLENFQEFSKDCTVYMKGYIVFLSKYPKVSVSQCLPPDVSSIVSTISQCEKILFNNAPKR